MTNLLIKSGLGLIIFLLTLIGGLLPFLKPTSHRASRRIVFCGEYFSRGIFFGGGLIHMLPDAQALLSQVLPHIQYPYVMTICALTIYLLQFIEQGLTKIFKLSTHHQQSWSSYLLTTLLSIHSIILGAALGVEDSFNSIIVIFIAIIAHKMAEAFALGINLRSSHITTPLSIRIMIIYGFMTPIGIFLGSGLQSFLQANAAHIVEGLFQAIAAGTFLYVASFNHVAVHDHIGTVSKLVQIHSLGLGIILMAILAIWA